MHHLTKFLIITLCLGISSAIQSSRPAPFSHAAELNLMQFLVQSRDLSQSNPQRSLACFEYYVPELNAIVDEYERSYTACAASADEKRLQVDEQTQPERDSIESSSRSSCELLSTCSQKEDSISYFECYVNAGADNSKSMYTISTLAADALTDVREKYRLIDNEEGVCTTAAERTYVEKTAATYEALQSCLAGESTPPTKAPVTPEDDTTIPENDSTAAPEQDTTAAPEDDSTAAPEQDTTAGPVENETTAEPEGNTTESESDEETSVVPEQDTTAGPVENETTAEPEGNTTESESEEDSNDTESDSDDTDESVLPEEDLSSLKLRNLKLYNLRQLLKQRANN